MKRKTVKYTDKDLGKLKVVDDFLPPPEDLVLKEDTVKVTLALSKASVDYFKSQAKKNDTHYQTMIRRLLDRYVAHYHSKS